MQPRLAHLHLMIAALSLLLTTAASGDVNREECERDFAPRSGQSGKDVIWVPTQEELVMAMLKAAKVTAKDYVIDLGSGDGRIPIAAAKHFDAKALGLEYNPKMVELAQCFVKAEGLSDKVEIRQADIFETDFRDATVVTLYLLPNLNMKLRTTILKLKPGTRIVSNSFDFGDWNADQQIEPPNGYTRGYLWIVPADVKGTWSLREEGGDDSFQVRLEQKFQEVEAAVPDGSAKAVRNVRLSGDDIELNVVNAKGRSLSLKGKVADDTLRLSSRVKGKTVNYAGKRI